MFQCKPFTYVFPILLQAYECLTKHFLKFHVANHEYNTTFHWTLETASYATGIHTFYINHILQNIIVYSIMWVMNWIAIQFIVR
jgi:TM2 domain-containing membrane protein YozV